MPETIHADTGVEVECLAFTGSTEQATVEQLADRAIARTEPNAILCEPVPGPRRVKPFSGLITPGHWPAQRGTALAEARVLYAGGMLHLLRAGGGVRDQIRDHGRANGGTWRQGKPACP